MSKVLPYMGATLGVLAISWTTQVRAQDAAPFEDVKSDHWAYEAITRLQAKKIIIGYPDHHFSGKRLLTRYEFAVALDRAYKEILANANAGAGTPGPAGKDGKDGVDGKDGKDGAPGMTPEEVDALRKLTNEFKAELARLGTNMKAVNDRLDSLAQQVAAINRRLDKMIQFNGDLFTGFRVDRSRNSFVDYSGAVRSANNSLIGNVTSVQDFHLTGHANLAGGVKANFDAAFSNYLGYRTGPDALSTPGASPNGGNRNASTFINEANLVIPIGSVGANTKLTIGRFHEQNTPLTFWKPDYDAYFDIPWYDDGTYVQDGFDISSKFGSATTKIFAGSFSSVTDNFGTFNRPYAGAAYGRNAFAANQVAGVHVGVPLFKFGELGLSLLDFSQSGGTATGGNSFGNEVVYGANFKLKPISGFNISAEAAKSVPQTDFQNGVKNLDNESNNAYLVNVGFKAGGVNSTVGYQYYDPNFSAPGYWNKIGNNYNPTNASGPFARFGYDLSNKIGLNLGADFLEGARNRAAGGNGNFLDTKGSSAFRALGGVKYHFSKHLSLSADYEGVFYSISAASTGTGRRAKPIEQYLTFGVGANLAGNTVLKLAYQILSTSSAGFGTPNSNASTLTTQVAVHF